MFDGDRGAGDIPADDEAWEQEERAAIFTGPVARRELKFGVEREAVVDGLRGGGGRREVGEVLPE